MKKVLLSLVLLLLVFYHIYPQAISFFGFSFIFTSGALGLGLFLYNKNRYTEVVTIIVSYLPIFFASLVAGYMSTYFDPYIYNYAKTQIAWIFSAYLVVFLFFEIFPKGSLIQFLYFIIAAIVLQCYISILMYYNDAARDFFNSLQMTDAEAEFKRSDTEGKRLLGYGIAFFGAGIICGLGLIFTVYVIMNQKLKFWLLFFLTCIYTFIFYIGLLSARTTVVGLVASLILFVLLLFKGKASKGQGFKFISLGVLFVFIGYTLCYIYFTEFADWAFELLINYEKSGELRTHSSDGLESMFIIPTDLGQWMFGHGGMAFWGTDVGYSRLLFYFGIPGTLAYFFYQLVLLKMSLTNNIALNLTLLIMFGYNLALNVKGLSELNCFMYLIVFYFLHYKYNIYNSSLYKIGKINSTKFRHAVQGPAPRRRL